MKIFFNYFSHFCFYSYGDGLMSLNNMLTLLFLDVVFSEIACDFLPWKVKIALTSTSALSLFSIELGSHFKFLSWLHL